MTRVTHLEVDSENQIPSSQPLVGSSRCHKIKGLRWCLPTLLALSISGATACADTTLPESWTDALRTTFEELVQEGSVIGAQVVAGQAEQIQLDNHMGWRSHQKLELVDADTMFGIGSDSKPMASAVVMKLVEEDRLKLDDPISRWLPAFDSAPVDGRWFRRPLPHPTRDDDAPRRVLQSEEETHAPTVALDSRLLPNIDRVRGGNCKFAGADVWYSRYGPLTPV